MVKIKSITEREFQSQNEKNLKIAKLKQLDDRYGVRDYMAELFLTEIKLSPHGENEKEKETARLLGLI